MNGLLELSSVLFDEGGIRWTDAEKESALQQARSALEPAVIHRAAAILLGRRSNSTRPGTANEHLRLSASFAGAIFEDMPKTPTDYRQRVVAEKKELDAKQAKLATFLEKYSFRLSCAEREMMARQLTAMAVLSDVLGERISAF